MKTSVTPRSDSLTDALSDISKWDGVMGLSSSIAMAAGRRASKCYSSHKQQQIWAFV
jgi:hypothetical protein